MGRPGDDGGVGGRNRSFPQRGGHREKFSMALAAVGICGGLHEEFLLLSNGKGKISNETDQTWSLLRVCRQKPSKGSSGRQPRHDRLDGRGIRRPTVSSLSSATRKEP